MIGKTMASFAWVEPPAHIHTLVFETGIIKMAGECHGRIMQVLEYGTDEDGIDVGSYELPRAEEPLLSIMYRNRQCWAPISELTGQFLHRYRHELRDFMTYHYQISNNNKKKDDMKDDAMVEMVLSLYTEMNKEKRAEFIHSELFKKSKLAGYICHVCYEYSDTITKCIHTDCPGCCDTCHKIPLLIPRPQSSSINHKEGGDGSDNQPTIMDIVCPACKRTQKIKCPICLDTKKSEEMCLLGCHHAFCWKCYGVGVMKGQQITKCPLCREIIVEVIEN